MNQEIKVTFNAEVSSDMTAEEIKSYLTIMMLSLNPSNLKIQEEAEIYNVEATPMNEVSVNMVSLARSLAEAAVFDEMVVNGDYSEVDLITYDEDELDFPEEDRISKWTDEAQECYDRHYDYFYAKIEAEASLL